MAEKKGAGGEPQTYDERTGRYGSGGGKTQADKIAEAERIYNSDGYGGEHIATPAEEKRFRELGIHQSGAQSGAIDEDTEYKRAEEHAKKMYETYRRKSSDIPKVAKVTGHTEDEIRLVKNHMFFNEYDLYGGRRRFDPDFQQAQSWIRLESGKPEKHDLIMVEHELIEERLMREQGLSYEEAHAKANETANYQMATKEYKNALVKKKRN